MTAHPQLTAARARVAKAREAYLKARDELTAAIAQESAALDHASHAKPDVLQTIISVCAREAGCTGERFLGPEKFYSISHPRLIAMALALKMTKLSLEDIAKAFRKKDHASVCYAVKAVEERRHVDREFAALEKRITAAVEQALAPAAATTP